MRRALAIAAFLLVTLIAFVALIRHDFVAPPGEEVQYDDMAFALVSHRTAPSLLGGVAPRNGVFHVVGVRAINRAKRVDHTTGTFEPILVGGDGRPYEISTEGQAAIDAGKAARGWGDTLLHLGDAVEAEYVFDAPENLGDAVVRISCGGAFVRLLDDVVLGKMRLRLPPANPLPE
jgi:hypothetical protein